MKGITAVLIAAGILWAADAFFNDGRFADVILQVVRSAALSMGLRV